MLKTRKEKLNYLTGKGSVENFVGDYKDIDYRLYKDLPREVDNPKDDDILEVIFKEDGTVNYIFKRTRGNMVVEEIPINEKGHGLDWWENEWLDNWVRYFEENKSEKIGKNIADYFENYMKGRISEGIADIVSGLFKTLDKSNEKEPICKEEEFDRLVEGTNSHLNALQKELNDMIKNLHIMGYLINFRVLEDKKEVFAEVEYQNGLSRVITKAKCRPSDYFSELLGKVIALRRAYTRINPV